MNNFFGLICAKKESSIYICVQLRKLKQLSIVPHTTMVPKFTYSTWFVDTTPHHSRSTCINRRVSLQILLLNQCVIMNNH